MAADRLKYARSTATVSKNNSSNVEIVANTQHLLGSPVGDREFKDFERQPQSGDQKPSTLEVQKHLQLCGESGVVDTDSSASNENGRDSKIAATGVHNSMKQDFFDVTSPISETARDLGGSVGVPPPSSNLQAPSSSEGSATAETDVVCNEDYRDEVAAAIHHSSTAEQLRRLEADIHENQTDIQSFTEWKSALKQTVVTTLQSSVGESLLTSITSRIAPTISAATTTLMTASSQAHHSTTDSITPSDFDSSNRGADDEQQQLQNSNKTGNNSKSTDNALNFNGSHNIVEDNFKVVPAVRRPNAASLHGQQKYIVQPQQVNNRGGIQNSMTSLDYLHNIAALGDHASTGGDESISKNNSQNSGVVGNNRVVAGGIGRNTMRGADTHDTGAGAAAKYSSGSSGAAAKDTSGAGAAAKYSSGSSGAAAKGTSGARTSNSSTGGVVRLRYLLKLELTMDIPPFAGEVAELFVSPTESVDTAVGRLAAKFQLPSHLAGQLAHSLKEFEAKATKYPAHLTLNLSAAQNKLST
eukprot:Lankesteria_metandrocarpae@DN2991_c0_g1_i1.p1